MSDANHATRRDSGVHEPAADIATSALVVGPADDPAEREADEVADLIGRAITSSPPREQVATSRIKRSLIARSAVPLAASAAQSGGRIARSKSLEGRGAIGRAGGGVDDSISRRIERSPGRPLQPEVRGTMESAFGADFSAVRVHAGADAADLNRSLSAEAFTTGNDVFFSSGVPDIGSASDVRLLAHELTHVVQGSRRTTVSRSAPTVFRKFVSASVISNAHLRKKNGWGDHHGDKIKKGSKVLVNDTHGENQAKGGKTVVWRPAVNAALGQWGQAIPDTHRGYIRSTRVVPDGDDVDDEMSTLIRDVLLESETIYPMVGGQLAKAAHVKFLFEKAFRVPEWNTDSSTSGDFSPGYETITAKLGRIREGADYLASSVVHWLDWLHPDGRTMVWNIKLMESDLHEQGLGVAMVEFRKSPGPSGHKFAADTTVKAMLKPEDKSLEADLLGDEPGSAANRINQIVGLTDPDEMLTTIRMQTDKDHGTLVEVVKGLQADKMTPGPHATKAVFHETLVFAFLAGIDDLHGENVFWHNGRPYLIDADNVLIRNQMAKEASGDIDQSGFNRYNTGEAAENRAAIKSRDNSKVNSKILDAMINNQGKRVDIAKALRGAMRGKVGRVVPIASRFWGQQVGLFRSQEQYRDQNLSATSSEQIMVGKIGKYDSTIGAGLIGVAGQNLGARMYDQQKEKAEQRKDFTAGVIPFYEYEFSTGKVTHNKEHIWNGLTVDQAIGVMLDRFDPTGVSRTAAGL